MYYAGVDIGGTFTDCVLVDRQGNHWTAKVLSTKDDPVAEVVAGLTRLAETADVDLAALLEETERLGHGTTIGTNAVLERRGGDRAGRRPADRQSVPGTAARSRQPGLPQAGWPS